MTIEEKIRAKKEEIKRVNRELSRLQDEARAKNEPMTIHVSHSSIGPATEKDPRGRVYNFDCKIISNKKDLNNIDFLNNVQKAIESLSEPSEPKSPIDWSNPEYDGYNWAAIDDDGDMGLYHSRPHEMDGTWSDNFGWKKIYTKPWASWDKSLIHRPGIKE